MAAHLIIGTINTNGTSLDRLKYINKAMETCDILCVQEHWLHNDQISNLTKHVENSNVHGISGMDSCNILKGRPYGGCAIMWRNNFQCSVTPLNLNSKRVCGIKFELKNSKYLVYCVYMPMDGQNEEEYREVLECINMSSSANNIDNVIIAGDFNTDFNRRESKHTELLCKFIKDECLIAGHSLPFANGEYTFESRMNGYRSTIDHILYSDCLRSNLCAYDVVHDGDNLSDHALIVAQIQIDERGPEDAKENGRISKALWEKANSQSILQYRLRLDELMCKLCIPNEALKCTNKNCKVHREDINSYCREIENACLQASEESIPHSNTKGARQSIPGWTEIVEPERQRSLLWHSIWKDNNSPKTGVLADIRRATRAKYHLAVRQVKKNAEKEKATKMASAILNDNHRDFWSEVKRARGSRKCSPNQIQGKTTEAEISGLFAEKYKDLYTSVPTDDTHLRRVSDDITNGINQVCDKGLCYSKHTVIVDDVKKAVGKLKMYKNDGNTGISSCNFIYGTDSLFVHLSLLLDAVLSHGMSSDNMLLSVIIPIPKNMKKSLNDVDNYRAIALSSPICKILDIIILNQNEHIFESSPCQFGYKSDSSTTKCTLVATEVVNYYLQSDSTVYSTLLDASKAFDRVHYGKLFEELLSKGLCPLVCKLLLLQYTMQQYCVRFGNILSEKFVVKNGVKQGGVLSPILFNMYMDILLRKLQASRMGCYIGNRFAGALCYADDIMLLTPTRKAMNSFLLICENYSREYELMFNASKSKTVVFNSETDDMFSLHGNHIEIVQSEAHLGNFFGANSFHSQIDRNIRDLYMNFNLLLAQFSHVNVDIKYTLFKSFCLSMYGSQLWNFESELCEKFYVAWRKCVRRLFKLPQRAHCDLLHHICEDIPIEAQLHCRFGNFLNSCLQSKNYLIKTVCINALGNPRSNLNMSTNFMCHTYNINRNCNHFSLQIKKYVSETIDHDSARQGTLIKDFLRMNDDQPDANISDIVDYLCLV